MKGCRRQQAWRAWWLVVGGVGEREPITAAIYRAGFPDSSSYYRHADQTLLRRQNSFAKAAIMFRSRADGSQFTRMVPGGGERKRDLRDSPGDSDDALLAELHPCSGGPPRTFADALFSNGAAGCRGYQHTRCAALVAAGYSGNRVSTAVFRQALCAIPLRRNRYQQLAATIIGKTHGGTRGRQRVRRE